MKTLLPGFLLLVLFAPAGASTDAYDLSSVSDDVKSIVHQYYPYATFILEKGGRVQFEFSARMYSVHIANKIGVWQDAVEVKGPELDGIVGVITVHEGVWQGAAVLPQQFDHCYFTDYVAVFYSERLDVHLYLSVKYPDIYPAAFMKDLLAYLPDFEKHM